MACAEIFADGTVSSPQSCLESEHHYSYPHVFRCGKELLMVPESLGSNSVDLYRCIEFPAKWSVKERYSKADSSIQPPGSVMGCGGL